MDNEGAGSLCPMHHLASRADGTVRVCAVVLEHSSEDLGEDLLTFLHRDQSMSIKDCTRLRELWEDRDIRKSGLVEHR